MTDEELPSDPPSEPTSVHDATGLDLARSIAGSVARLPLRAVERRSGWRRPEPTKASGTHPDDRDPQLLDATIGRLVAERGWGEDVRVHGVFSRWAAIVGPDVARHARPVSFERGDPTASPPGGRLTVQTDSTAWATEVRLLAGTVVRRLNEALGEGTVRVVDVKGPEAPSWRHGRRSLRDARGPRDTYG
jgi:predicted nucleic acid-binding Zn ribbon protein